MSSGNPFHARVTDGRKELKYCCDFAGTVWRSDSLRRGYLAILPTVGGGGGGQARRDILVASHVASYNKV